MRRRKIIFIVVTVLILVTVLREAGVVSINFYRSQINSSTTANWNSTGTTFDAQKDDILWSTFKDQLNDSCNLNYTIQNISILSFLGSESAKSGNDSCHRVVVQGSNFNPGSIWTPIYKSTSFSASASCIGNITITVKTENGLRQKIMSFSGTISITGNFRLTGLCSYREAKRILARHINEQFIQETRNELFKL